MSNKRYYWLKLNENFFEDDTVAWIEEQENGKDYIIFYLKLCLKSLTDDGYLIRYVGEKLIPYDVKALSKLTNTDYDTVKVAMNLFLEVGIISQLDSGELYLNQINEMIGSETESAKRVRKHRLKQETLQSNKLELQSNSDVIESNTEIDKEIEKELEIDKEIDIDKEQKKPVNKLPEKDLKSNFDSIWKEYPNKKGKVKAFTSYKKAIKDGVDNQTIIDGISAYKKEIEIKRTEPEYIAHGSTWFSQKRWEDDYQTSGKVINSTFAQEAPMSVDNLEVSDEEERMYQEYLKKQGEV